MQYTRSNPKSTDEYQVKSGERFKNALDHAGDNWEAHKYVSESYRIAWYSAENEQTRGLMSDIVNKGLSPNKYSHNINTIVGASYLEQGYSNPKNVSNSNSSQKNGPNRQAPNRVSAKLNNNPKQFQKKFKHAEDFGVEGNYNQTKGNEFKSAIEKHMNSPETLIIKGSYRSSDNPVTFYINKSTGLNAVVDPSGNFVTGSKLNPQQVSDVLTRKWLW